MREVVAEAEHSRAETLKQLQLLDSPPEHDFDILAVMARRLLGVRMAFFTLIDADRQWFKARCGLDVSETPRSQSFCTIAVEANDVLIVADATRDPRFATNPLVLGKPHIRFYAGVPVRATSTKGESIPIGTFCVADDMARAISPDDLASLHDFARLAEVLIEARATAMRANALARESHETAVLLHREQQQFKQAERMAQMGSWRLSLADNVLNWSDGVYSIYELPLGERPPVEAALQFYPLPDREVVAEAMASSMQTGEPFGFDTDFVTAKGNRRRVRGMGEMETKDGQATALVGVFQDITETHRLERELLRLSRTDELTQMANRAEFNRVLDAAMLDARASGRPLAVLLIDLDGFKAVNDRFGHGVGDDLLRRIAEVFEAPSLANCLAARLGGDEFAVIVSAPEDCDAIDAIVQDLLGRLRMTVDRDHGSLQVSGTIGVAWFDGNAAGRSELLRQADVALYSAKRRQRGTAETYQAGHRVLSVDLPVR